MPRFLLFALSILCSSPTFGQSAPPKPRLLTYTTVAVPLRKALEEIGKQIGSRFEVDGPMSEDPIILKLNAVPLKDVMDRIASMEGAEWKNVDGTLVLFRSSDDLDRLTAKETSRHAAAIQKSVDELALQAAKAGRMTQTKAEDLAQKMVQVQKERQAGASPMAMAELNTAIIQADPSTRLFAQIISTFDPAQLAALRPGGRYVFSSHPTAMQYPLPPFDPDLLKQFFVDKNLLNDTISQAMTSSDGISPEAVSRYQHQETPPVKVRVIVQPFVGIDRLLVTLELIKATGDHFTTPQGDVASSWDPMQLRPMEAEMLRGSKAQGVALSEQTMELVHHVMQSSADPTIAPLDPDLLERLATPTLHDPLSFAISDVVLSLASSQHTNAIVLPNDSDEELTLLGCRTGFITWDLFKLELLRTDRTGLALENGWLTGRPLSPLRNEASQWPRPALEKFTLAIRHKGYAGIDDLAQLMLATPHGSGYGEIEYYEALMMARDMNPQGPPSEEALRLWAALGEDQKAAAAKTGLALSRDQLDSGQRSLANDFVYLGYRGLGVETSALRGLKPDQYEPAFDAAMRIEKTDEYGSGIPPEATFEFKDAWTDNFAFTQMDQNGHKRQSSGDLNELAVDYAMAQRADLFPSVATYSPESIGYGSQRKVTITVHLDGKHYISEDMTENHKMSDARVNLSQIRTLLVGDALDRFDKRVQELLATYKNLKKSDVAGVDDNPEPQPSPPPGYRT